MCGLGISEGLFRSHQRLSTSTSTAAVRKEGQAIQEGKWTVPHLSACILRDGDEKLTHFDLGPAEPIQEAATVFLERLVTSESRGVSLGKAVKPLSVKEANHALRILLWDPIAEHVNQAKTVFISPDKFLGTIPFEVLQMKDITYLIEDHAFVYLQDMESLVELAKEKGSPRGGTARNTFKSLLAIGGVDYRNRGDLAWKAAKKEKDTIKKSSEELFSSDLLAKAGTRGSSFANWGDLPGTRLS